MKLFKIFKKFWNDSVWSKVISAGIIFLMGFVITSIFNASLIKNIIYFFKRNIYLSIIFIQLFILLIIFVKYFLNKIRTKKPDLSWLKKYINSTDFINTPFLLWFPLNGVMRSSVSRLSAENNLKILHSRIIKPLIDKNIISFNVFGSVEINEKTYDVLNNFIRNNFNMHDKNESEVLFKIKLVDFPELLLRCATHTEYE
jgi:hypothetical protein